MPAFIARRIAAMLLVLLCVVTITFFLIRIAPGGPFDRERKIPAAIEKQLLKKYKLDGPLSRQYFDYLSDLLRGDLRLSTKYRDRSVNELIAHALPVSAKLGMAAFCIATFTGVWLGAWAASRHHTALDRGAMFAALLAISIPTFVTGPLLILIFGLKLFWLPVGGWGSWRSLILPSVTLAGPLHRIHRPPHAREHAGGARPGFYPHRARQGRRGVEDHLQARDESLDPAGGLVSRSRSRRICSPAPSSSRRSSTSPAWAGFSSTRSRTATASCSAASSSFIARCWWRSISWWM